VEENMATSTRTDERFRTLAEQWKSESQYMSNSAQMAMLRSYQKIIGMGEPAVPLLLSELRNSPDQWFWALESITDANPIRAESAGFVDRMAADWIEWGIEHGYISR